MTESGGSGGAAGRSRLEPLLRRVRPRAVAGYTPPPRELDAGLWILERRLRFPPGLTLPCTTTLVRLPGGGLLVHSPPRPDAVTVQAIRSLGRVEAVLAPNSFHHVFAGEFMDAFPEATLFLAPGLRERVPTLPPARVLSGELPASFAPDIDARVFLAANGLSELALYHRPSATLILTDLAFNLAHHPSRIQALLWRLAGMPAGFGPSRNARLMLLRDRRSVARFLHEILDWELRRVIVSHGEPLETEVRAAFARAFAAYLDGSGSRKGQTAAPGGSTHAAAPPRLLTRPPACTPLTR